MKIYAVVVPVFLRDPASLLIGPGWSLTIHANLSRRRYDAAIYERTRRRIMSPANPYWVKGKYFSGMGSPHTPRRNIWPLAEMIKVIHGSVKPKVAFGVGLSEVEMVLLLNVFCCCGKQGLTTNDAEDQAVILRSLLDMQCGNGLMHESIHVDHPVACTRPIFEWANEMLGTPEAKLTLPLSRNLPNSGISVLR